MRRIVISLILVLVAAAAYLVGGLAHPTPNLTTPPSEDPYAPVCPTPTTTTAAHAALLPRRGAGCPDVIATMTIGGEST